MQFRSLGTGGVTYTVTKVDPIGGGGWSRRVALLTFLGVVGLAIYGIWRLALVYKRPRIPDQ